eukprot:210763_1
MPTTDNETKGTDNELAVANQEILKQNANQLKFLVKNYKDLHCNHIDEAKTWSVRQRKDAWSDIVDAFNKSGLIKRYATVIDAVKALGAWTTFKTDMKVFHDMDDLAAYRTKYRSNVDKTDRRAHRYDDEDIETRRRIRERQTDTIIPTNTLSFRNKNKPSDINGDNSVNDISHFDPNNRYSNDDIEHAFNDNEDDDLQLKRIPK